MGNEVLISAGDREALKKIRDIVSKQGYTDGLSVDWENLELLDTIDRIEYNLTFGMNYYKKLPDTEQKWFDAICNTCGWEGSSEYLQGCHAIGDTGDYTDPLCPVCGSNQVD